MLVAAIRGDVVADVEEVAALVVEPGEVHLLERAPPRWRPSASRVSRRLCARLPAPARAPPARRRPRPGVEPRPGRSRRRTRRASCFSSARKAGGGRLAGRGQVAERGLAGQASLEGGPRRPPAPRRRFRAGRRSGGLAMEPPTEDRGRCRAASPRGARAPGRTRREARQEVGIQVRVTLGAITESSAWSSSVPPRSSSRTMPRPHALRRAFSAIASSPQRRRRTSRSGANRAAPYRGDARSITPPRTSSVSSNPSQRAGPTTDAGRARGSPASRPARHPARFPLSTVET